jgi:uncharacterized protein YjbI with pentapeptide repeats
VESLRYQVPGSFATLINVNLSGANLTGAKFTGVKSGGVIGTPATLPNGFALVNGVFYG